MTAARILPGMIQTSGQHGGAVVSTVDSEQEGSWFCPVQSLHVLLCLTSSHCPKTCRFELNREFKLIVGVIGCLPVQSRAKYRDNLYHEKPVFS